MDIRAIVVNAMYWHTPAGESRTYQRRKVADGQSRTVWRSLSVKKLAEMSGVPVRSVNDFVNGTSNINSDTLGRILDTLGLSIQRKSDTVPAVQELIKVIPPIEPSTINIAVPLHPAEERYRGIKERRAAESERKAKQYIAAKAVKDAVETNIPQTVLCPPNADDARRIREKRDKLKAIEPLKVPTESPRRKVWRRKNAPPK